MTQTNTRISKGNENFLNLYTYWSRNGRPREMDYGTLRYLCIEDSASVEEPTEADRIHFVPMGATASPDVRYGMSSVKR